jgi:Fatty acid hydroxylase
MDFQQFSRGGGSRRPGAVPPCSSPASRLASAARRGYRKLKMAPEESIRAATTARGRRIKRNNLIAATLSGGILVGISSWLFPSGLGRFLLGFVAGLFYANSFEYCLHRFVLHLGRGVFCQQHMAHHATWKSPEAARYVNFSSNPWGVVALIVLNALPFLALEWVLHLGISAGIFVSFAIYYMLFEEIHWRSHMGGWLPRFVRSGARHHLLHHVHDDERFNVFLPIWDRLLGLPRARQWKGRFEKQAR